MLKPRIYVETSIPSYLAARPSRDLVVAAQQQITHRWWETVAEHFDLYISEVVMDEIRVGDPEVAQRRFSFVDGLAILKSDEETLRLTKFYDGELGLTGKARADLPHFAFAVAYQMDFLATWNCSHIANAIVIRRLHRINEAAGLHIPIILTPSELEPSTGEKS
jgi:hypothetical protein